MRRFNPRGDEWRRDLERRAAQGDPAARAALEHERSRFGLEQQPFEMLGDYLPWVATYLDATWGAFHGVDGRFRATGRVVNAEQRAYALAARLNGELSDGEVIAAFLRRLVAHGRKLTSINMSLDGNWMGGGNIANWALQPSASLHLPPEAVIVENDLGSKAAEKVQRALRKAARAAGVKVVMASVHRDRGRGDYTGVCGQTDRNSKLTSHNRYVTCAACRSMIDNACSCGGGPGGLDPRCELHGTLPPRAGNPAPMMLLGMGPLTGLMNPGPSETEKRIEKHLRKCAECDSGDACSTMRRLLKEYDRDGADDFDLDAPGPGERGDMGAPPKWKKKRLRLSDVKHLPGYAEALAAYRRFHDRDPKFVEAYTYDDGKKTHTTKLVVGLGKVPETHYVTPWPSNKKGYHWVHKHPGKGQPLEVLDPVTGLTMKIGGTYRVTDWWRK